MVGLVQLILVVALAGTALGHTYHKGPCPVAPPLPVFEMNKFLGKWYVIQKTKTHSKCVTYTFKESTESGEYDLEQASIHPLFNHFPQKGHLTVPSSGPAAQMRVKFNMNILGSASYTVVSTDYNTFGAIFTCQEMLGFHRQSVTILSRNETLNKSIVDAVRNLVSSFGVDVRNLNEIDQLCCSKEKKVLDDPVLDEDGDDSAESLKESGEPDHTRGTDLTWRGAFEDNDITNKENWIP